MSLTLNVMYDVRLCYAFGPVVSLVANVCPSSKTELLVQVGPEPSKIKYCECLYHKQTLSFPMTGKDTCVMFTLLPAPTTNVAIKLKYPVRESC